jgi:hypothetical protein
MPNTVNLEATRIRDFGINPQFGPGVPMGSVYPRDGAPHLWTRAQQAMFGMMLYKRKMDADFSEKLKALETEVSTDIQRILAEISILSDPRRTEELVLRMSLLIESKRRAISKLEGPANAFFNTSALDKTPTDYWRVASSTQSIAKGYREWAESYAAALSIALFDKYITIVQERQQVAQTHVAILRTAQRLAEQQASMEAGRLAAQQAEHESGRLAEEQVEQERARLAEEQAEHTKVALSGLTQPITSEAKPAAELAEAQRQMASAAAYVAHASDAGRVWSVIAGPHNPTQQLPGNWEKANDIAKRIFVRRLSTVLGRRVSILAALYPSDMSSGERTPHMFAVDASALGVSPNTDIGFIASKRGTVHVTHRLMPDIEAQDGRLQWVKTDGVDVDSRVRVRPVVYDPPTNTYTFTRDGETTPALIWTPQAPLTDSSTRLPSVQQGAPIYGGAGTAIIPEDYIHPEHVAEPDDYILDLPAELGLGQPYIYFRNPRKIPGVASGYGQPVVGTWLGESTTGQGVAIPSQIADKLRGKRFSSFDRLREEFWREVAKDPELSAQFATWDVDLMNEGVAPYAAKAERRGNRKKMEIHHIHEVAKGGQVYDFSNMIIMTPNTHIHHHRKPKK